MATILAIFASLLLPAARGLGLRPHRPAGPEDYPREALQVSGPNTTKRRENAGPLRTPQYVEAAEYAAYQFCEESGQFSEGELDVPGHPFNDFIWGPFTTLPSGSYYPDECAAVCALVSGCKLFSASEDPSYTGCFVYTACTNPITVQLPNTIYTMVGLSGDPHLRNLAGEKFDVNQPGEYVLLRVPQQLTRPALLEMHGHIGAAEDAPCGLYMKTVTLAGTWLGAAQVQVRSLKGKSFQGTWPNGWPFAVRATSSTSSTSEGEWRSWDNATAESSAADALPGTIAVRTIFRKEEAAAGRLMEAQAFEFRVGTEEVEKRPAILVAQGSHEGLDVSLSMMSMFHESELGGLLGTEKHDKEVEVHTAECRAWKGRGSVQRVPQTTPRSGSVFTASWD